MGVHVVELTPATLAHVLTKGEEGEEGDEEEEEEWRGLGEEGEGEKGDEKGNAQLAELPEGLLALAGEVRELVVRITRLAVLPGWVGELTRLEALEVLADARPPALDPSVIVIFHERNALLKSLPASLGQLGALKQLTLAWLDGLEELPDALVTLTSLGSLMIECCGKLRALPRRIAKLGALKQLTLRGLNELQDMPDPIGLTALDSLTAPSSGRCRGESASLGR